MKFDDPSTVSNGKMFDVFYIKVKNPHLFVSKATGERMPADFETLNDVLPRQVPKGVDVPALLGLAQQSFFVLLALLIVLIVFKLFYRNKSFEDCWILLFATQMVVYLEMVEIPLPANANVFF